jgi:hypothetical protein
LKAFGTVTASAKTAAMVANPNRGMTPWSVRTRLPSAANQLQASQSRASTRRPFSSAVPVSDLAVTWVTLRKA